MRQVVVRWLFIIPALLFANWLIMILIGCLSSLCHAGDKYFCSVYCYTGITLLSVTLLFVLYLLFRKRTIK